MRILDRYIIFEFVKILIFTLMALTIVFFLADYLRGIIDEDVAAFTLFQYNAFQLPQFMCQMTPAAAMLATMVTLSLLNRKNELTAIKASGVSIAHIAILIFGVIFITCCMTLTTKDRLVPPMAKQRVAYYWQMIKHRNDISLDIRTSKIWYRNKNYIYNLRLFDKATNTIQGLGIYFFDDKFNLLKHMEAQTARYDSSKNVWELKDGMLTILSKDVPFPKSKHFDDEHLVLPEKPNDFLEIEHQMDTLRLRDLRNFIKRNKEAGIDTKAYEVDFHSRLAMSFVPLIMSLLAIPSSIRPNRQGGLGRDISTCAAWVFAYWLIFSISVSLGKSGTLSPWVAVWSPLLVFLGIAIYLVIED